MRLLSCTMEIFLRLSLSVTLSEMQTRAGPQLMAQLQPAPCQWGGREE